MLSSSSVQKMIDDLEKQKAQLVTQITSVESSLATLRFVLEKSDEELTRQVEAPASKE